MSKDDHPIPTLSPKGQTDADERRRRQAEALRANLARRKAQSRAREDETPPASTDPAGNDPQ
jgi:hypothetical protein